MVRRTARPANIQKGMDNTNMSKVLFKRKPVGLIPHPLNIKDDAEVCLKSTRDQASAC